MPSRTVNVCALPPSAVLSVCGATRMPATAHAGAARSSATTADSPKSMGDVGRGRKTILEAVLNRDMTVCGREGQQRMEKRFQRSRKCPTMETSPVP